MAWTAILAVVAYSATKTWPDDVPAEQRTPLKERGEVAYVVSSLPDGPAPAGTVSPYVFLQVTGISDSVTPDKVRNVLARINKQNGRVFNRHNGRIDFSLLPVAVRNALQTPGAVATITVAQLRAACDLRIEGRKLTAGDLA